MSNLNGETLPKITKMCDKTSKLDSLLTYYNSKLCNMIISKQLGEILKPFNVSCNCVHPGMTNSNFLLKNLDFIRTGYYGTLVHRILNFITQVLHTYITLNLHVYSKVFRVRNYLVRW